MTTMKGKTLVTGHTLLFEGAPFDARGQRCPLNMRVGYGKCSCGELGPTLEESTKARQRWHKEHKDLIREGKKPVDWKTIALHALSDLRALGIPIEKILLMTPDILKAVGDYERDMTSYS